MTDHGPYVCSALPQYKRKVDVLGSWSKEYFEYWNVSTVVTKEEYDHYCTSLGFGLPNVGVSENYNLSSVQKELLLYHWKLGIGQ